MHPTVNNRVLSGEHYVYDVFLNCMALDIIHLFFNIGATHELPLLSHLVSPFKSIVFITSFFSAQPLLAVATPSLIMLSWSGRWASVEITILTPVWIAFLTLT